jgi:hypothetical protein
MATRLERLKKLRDATKEYVATEKKRIENEVSVLEAVLKGRTGGKGIQQNNTAVVSKAAEADLAAYLTET